VARSRKPPAIEPRKQPRQARARVTRDAMVLAAEQVLARHGVAGLTTNLVAEVAGVSIGSLYQYFPNKQAIVIALIERNASQLADVVTRVLAAHPAGTPEEVALALGLGLRAAFHGQGKVHRALYDQAPSLGLLPALEAVLARITDDLARWLAAHPRLDVAEPQATAWVFVHAVDGIARSFAMAHGELDEEAIARHTVAMVLAALPRARPPR